MIFLSKKIKFLNKIVLGTVIFLFIIFFLLFQFIFPKNSKETASLSVVIDGRQYDDIKNEKSLYSTGITSSLELNGIKCSYDKATKTFFYPINSELQGKSKKLNISFDEEESLSVVFYKNAVTEDMVFKIEINSPYRFIVYNEKKYTEYKLVFTTLPTITIFTDKSKTISNNDTLTATEIHDPNYVVHKCKQLIQSVAYFHTRGGLSSAFEKKSYKMELKKEDSDDPEKVKKNNVSLLGLRKDGDWILDAMFIDPARMRNKLSTEIWDDLGADSYPFGINNGAKGEYAEVFLNNSYLGLYVLLEPVDSLQLGINETDEKNGGLVIKTTSWEYTSMNEYEGAPSSKTWAGFEIRYPKEYEQTENSAEKKITGKDWIPFYDLIQISADYDAEDFSSAVENLIALDNILDYSIFVNAICAVDNVGKNMFWTIPDRNINSKFWITPWDLDLCWGITWIDNPSMLFRTKDDDSVNHILHFYFGEKVIASDVNGAKKKIKERWTELRKNIITTQVFNTRIDEIASLLTSSGAINRELKKWAPDIDFEEEVEYMKNWFKNRLPILDKYYRDID
ncbi:MAG: spore coat protein CotH [Clostridia bacterium]|nr:spore coat protein CotH [Clostridia bacterium]